MWRSSQGRLLVVLLASFVVWCYVTANLRLAPQTLATSEPAGYYQLLAEAFLRGQTHLNIAVDPLLLRLPNPYAGPQGANRPHDMSFYRGKFFLYYGASPALVLFVPWRLLTGTYLSEAGAIFLSCGSGFLLGVWWLSRLRSRCFPNANRAWLALAVLTLGLGSPVFALSQNPTFYAVPISSAFALLSLVVVIADRALQTRDLGPAAALLAAASLTHGLAVSARPNYLLGLCGLLVPAAVLWSRLPRSERFGPAGGRPWLAAIVPAAIVGLAMALYNEARFESPLEFGIRFSMASADIREARLIGPEFIRKNLQLYLVHAADFIRYFPFIHTNNRPYGVLPHFTLLVAVLSFPFTLLRPGWREAGWFAGGLFLLATGLANLAVLSLFFGGEDRYLADFTGPLLLLATGMLLAAGDSLARTGRIAWLATVFGAALAAWSIANGSALALGQGGPTPGRLWLESISNPIAYKLEHLRGVRQGPLELELIFPRDAVGRRDPLVTTGNLANTGDILYAQYPDSSHVQFGFFHLGAGGPLSDPVEIDFLAPHILELQLGSLLPPSGHPDFRGWTEGQIAAARRQLELRLDGRVVFRSEVNTYRSTPDGVLVGRNPLAADVSEPNFAGTILRQRRLGVPPPPARSAASGPLRLVVRLPVLPGPVPEPLVSTGRTGAGDLIYLERPAPGTLRFGHDHWGAGAVQSETMPCDPTVDHVIEIEMGSLYAAGISTIDSARQMRVVIRLDGREVMSQSRPFHPSDPEEVAVGLNAIGASSATGMFTGTIRQSTRILAAP